MHANSSKLDQHTNCRHTQLQPPTRAAHIFQRLLSHSLQRPTYSYRCSTYFSANSSCRHVPAPDITNQHKLSCKSMRQRPRAHRLQHKQQTMAKPMLLHRTQHPCPIPILQRQCKAPTDSPPGRLRQTMVDTLGLQLVRHVPILLTCTELLPKIRHSSDTTTYECMLVGQARQTNAALFPKEWLQPELLPTPLQHYEDQPRGQLLLLLCN